MEYCNTYGSKHRPNVCPVFGKGSIVTKRKVNLQKSKDKAKM